MFGRYSTMDTMYDSPLPYTGPPYRINNPERQLAAARSKMARSSDVLPDQINLLTFNCWGLKYISSLRSERISEVGNQLALMEPLPDIVCLQEIWTQEDYDILRRKTDVILPYDKFYYAGVFGGGLAILSRWPIVESSMTGYPLNGRPSAFFRGDWYVGKGIARTSIKIGPGAKDVIEVFNTHVCYLSIAHHICISHLE